MNIDFLPDFLFPTLIPMSDVAPINVPQVDRPAWVYWLFMAPTAVFWILAYAFAIHRARIDKRVGVPAFMVAVCFAWEFNLSVVLEQMEVQRKTNFFWLVLDIFIIAQAFRYGRKDFPTLTQRRFTVLMIGMLLWASALVILCTNELGDDAGVYTGTIVNIPLSALYILTLRSRGNSAGQSLYVAVAKALGSLFAGITVFIMMPGHYAMFIFFATIQTLDAVYIGLLYRTIRAEGQSPWKFRRPPVPDSVVSTPAVLNSRRGSAGAPAPAPARSLENAPPAPAGVAGRGPDRHAVAHHRSVPLQHAPPAAPPLTAAEWPANRVASDARSDVES